MKRNIFIWRLTAGVKSLKFAGIPESEGESREDTRGILVEFLSNQLVFHHPEEIEFQRIHRIGKKRDRPRMIIACFFTICRPGEGYEERL